MLLQFQDPVQTPNRHFIAFTKPELNTILGLYSFHVAHGAWRDYALDFKCDMAVFSIFRHAHETPLVSVIKLPANTATGYVFEVFFDRKRLSRTPHLHKALDALRESLLN